MLILQLGQILIILISLHLFAFSSIIKVNPMLILQIPLDQVTSNNCFEGRTKQVNKQTTNKESTKRTNKYH